jgi:hypothetical protein
LEEGQADEAEDFFFAGDFVSRAGEAKAGVVGRLFSSRVLWLPE